MKTPPSPNKSAGTIGAKLRSAAISAVVVIMLNAIIWGSLMAYLFHYFFDSTPLEDWTGFTALLAGLGGAVFIACIPMWSKQTEHRARLGGLHWVSLALVLMAIVAILVKPWMIGKSPNLISEGDSLEWFATPIPMMAFLLSLFVAAAGLRFGLLVRKKWYWWLTVLAAPIILSVMCYVLYNWPAPAL